MGLRGPVAKSAELRVHEGQRAHRPLPAPGAAHVSGLPERPKGMTPAARKVWNGYMARLSPLGVLRAVDGFALRRLCEDVALLETLQKGMLKQAAYMNRLAKDRLKVIEPRLAEMIGDDGKEEASLLRAERAEILQHLATGMINVLVASHEGRRQMATINALASRIKRDEVQFFLTPASGQRLEHLPAMPAANAVPGNMNPVEAALCG